MDFEKVFEDENQFRDKFNERLESFTEILNEIGKGKTHLKKQKMEEEIKRQ